MDAERLPWGLVLGWWPPPTVNQMVPVSNREEGQTLKMMAAIYFIIFITSEALICANLPVAVVTSSLWESLLTQAKEEQREQESSPERARTGHPGQAGSAGEDGQKASVKLTLQGPRFGGPP